jgi:hypothetical protein
MPPSKLLVKRLAALPGFSESTVDGVWHTSNLWYVLPML